MSRVIPRTARAAVTAGLSATLALGSIPTAAIAEALAGHHTASAQEGTQAQQSEEGAETETDAAAESATDTASGNTTDAESTTDTEPEPEGEGAENAETPAAEQTDDTEAPATAATDQKAATDAPATASIADTDVAKIGDTGYAALAQAVAALKDGDTLTILKTTADDVTISKNNVTITAADKTTVSYKGYMQVRGVSGVKVQNVRFEMQGRKVETSGNGNNFVNIGLRFFDASNAVVEGNIFDLPQEAPNEVFNKLEVSALYVSGTSDNLQVKNNTFDIVEHSTDRTTFRGISLRGRDANVANDKTLSNVTIDGNTVNMQGTNNSTSATSVFIDAVGGRDSPNYGIKDVTVSNNIVNAGQVDNTGANKTYGFLGVGIDGLKFTSNKLDKAGYAIVFGNDETANNGTSADNRNQAIVNIQIGGNDLSSTDHDIFIPADKGTLETRTNGEGILLVGEEKPPKTTIFQAGVRKHNDTTDPYRLFTKLELALQKVTVGQPADIYITNNNATTGVPVPAGQDVTLDLNGHTVSGMSKVDGALTVTDTDATAGAPGALSGAVNVMGTGTLTVQSGSVSGAVTSAGTTQVAGGDLSGNLTVTGGNTTVSGTGKLSGMVTTNAGSTFTVTGGEVTKPVTAAGTVTVSGGTVSGGVTTSGTMSVTNGTVSGKVTAQRGSQVTVGGGTLGAVDAETGSTVTINGGTFTGVVASGGGTVTITNGDFAEAPTGDEGKVTITGGTFSKKPSVLHAPDRKGFKLDATQNKYVLGDAEISFKDPVKNDEYTVDLKGPTKLDEATLVGLAEMSVEDYTVSIDQDTLNKINEALQKKDVTTTPTFTMTYTAKKNGTAKDTDASKVTKTLTIRLQDTRATNAVTFDMGGGTPQEPEQQVKTGEFATKPTTTPTKEGHTFKGWYGNAQGNGAEFDFTNTPITQATTIYAIYNANTYTVTFHDNANGETVTGMPNKIENVTWNTTATDPNATPKRTGYTFDGWYTSDTTQNDTTKYNWTTPVKADVNLYAKWNKNTYTITFNTSGGDPINPLTVSHGDTPTLPEATYSAKTGYTFYKWYKDKAGTQEYDSTVPVTGSMTLFAKWKLDVSFDLNGGTGNAPQTQQIVYGLKASKPDADPTRDGHTFQGWYTDQAGNASYNWDGTVIQPTTLYAKWSVNTYTVTYDGNGGNDAVTGVPAPKTDVAWDTSIDTEPPVPTRTGYTFAGWYTDAATSAGKEFQFGTTKVTDNITLYAKWIANDVVLTFDGNADDVDVAENVPANITGKFGDKVQQPDDPTRIGHEFTGWYTVKESDKQTDATKYDWTQPLDSSQTLYAGWKVKSYKLTFNSDGGTPNFPEQTVEYRDAATDPGTPTRTGYTFLGWFYNDTQWDFADQNSLPGMPAEDVTLTAKWKANEYTATFDYNYAGAPTAGTATIQHDGTVTAPNPDPTRAGYQFAGWFTDKEGTTAYEWATKVTGDVTLYAKWTADKNQVTFDTDGGSAVPGTSVDTGALVPRPTVTPTKTGYDFVAWVKADGTPWNFDTDTAPAGPLTLKAQWRLHEYTVSFDVNGGGSQVPASQKVAYQQKVSRPADPTREGYDFAGWVDQNGNPYDFNAPVTGDLALTAQWAIQQRTVTFAVNGGSAVEAQTVAWGGTLVKPADPTRDGFTFAGWFTDEALTQAYDFNAPVTGDLTLYAKWTENAAPQDEPKGDGGTQAPGAKTTAATTAATKTLPKTDDANNAAVPAAIAAIGSAFLGLAAALRRRRQE